MGRSSRRAPDQVAVTDDNESGYAILVPDNDSVEIPEKAVALVTAAMRLGEDDDIGRLRLLLPRIGHLPLSQIHRGALEPWIAQRREDGVSTGTINHGLKVVR